MNKQDIQKWSYRLVVAVLLVAGIWIVAREFLGHSGVVTTGNARICRHVVTQSVKVEGFIDRVCFDSYTQMKKGDTLVVIDDAEYRHELAQAKARLEQMRGGARQAGESVQTSSRHIGEAEASVTEMQTALERAGREEERYKTLLAQKAVTQQQYDDVHAAWLTDQARLDRAVKARQAQTTMKTVCRISNCGLRHGATSACSFPCSTLCCSRPSRVVVGSPPTWPTIITGRRCIIPP